MGAFPAAFIILFFFIFCSVAELVNGQSYLAQAALDAILAHGSPILGIDNGCNSSQKTCDWMSKISDETNIVQLNLPGTHDTGTWNYTNATQQSLLHYTGLDIPPASVFQTQQSSIFQSLNDGIRVFDFRIAYNPGNDTLGFYHSQALLAPTTTLEDVLFGLYSWLDKHATEALFVSIKNEGGTGTPYDFKFQSHLYDILQSPLAKKYWIQEFGVLDTLTKARGKITLIQRFTYTLLPSPPSPSAPHLIGIPLPDSLWTDNSKSIAIPYSPPSFSPTQFAYIEDYYEPNDLLINANVTETVNAKFDAVRAHLMNATEGVEGTGSQFYITFASAERVAGSPTISPKTMALGDGVNSGVNQQLFSWLIQNKGKRVGVIMLDFYDTIPGMVEAVIGL